MELKNTFSLTKEEAANLLYNVANSLKNRGNFEILIDNQKISLDIGENLVATLHASETKFSLEFDWQWNQTGEEEQVDWREKFDKDMAEAGLPIGDTETTPTPIVTTAQSAPQMPTETITATISELQSQGIGQRKLPDRMILETTTLPYEGGVWNPAFSLTYSTIWTEIGIDNQLENTKWISEEELEALQGTPRMPRRQMSEDGDDDLFDDLDSGAALDGVSTKRPQGGTRRRTTRQVVTPAAMIHHAAAIDTGMDEATIQEAAESWSEPEKERTDDEWVKPSEFIASKDKPSLDSPPPAVQMPPKKDMTPPPVKTDKSGKLDEEILGWKEPSAAESGEEWVKPSEILKEKNQPPPATPPPPTTKKSDKKKARPPPVAPDKAPSPKKSKKGKDKEDKKGWASWDN